MSELNKKTTLPNNINLDKWADVGFEWQGEIDVQDFERFQTLVQEGVLQLNLKLMTNDGVLWLNYRIAGDVSLDCCRCLEPMVLDLTGNYELALIERESQLALIGESEYVLFDELNLADAKMLPVKDLLEDNLILALPLSPKHEDCQPLLEEVEEDEPEEKDNPFLVLAELKGKLS